MSHQVLYSEYVISDPIPPNPQTAPPPAPTPVTQPVQLPPTKKPLSGLIAILIIAAFFLILFLAGSALWAVAYESIDIGNPTLQKSISTFMQDLPFAPKTPSYLLEKSMMAHQKISRHSFNISLAAQNNAPTSSLGLGNIDIQVVGDVDFSDPLNIQLVLNGKYNKDFNIDITKKDQLVYFKLNQFPAILTTFLGVEASKTAELTNRWVMYDTSPLLTDARKRLDEQPQTSVTQEYIQKSLTYLQDKTITKEMVVTADTIDGISAYKIHFTPNPATIDYLGEKMNEENRKKYPDLYKNQPKLSQTVKDLTLDLWIDTKDFYSRKLEFVATLSTNPSGAMGYMSGLSPVMSTGSEYKVASSLTLSNFGKEVVLQVPPTAIPWEQWLSELMKSTQIYSNTMIDATASTRDTQRRTDLYAITNAVYQYAVENKGQLPPQIPKTPTNIGTKPGLVNLTTTLVPTYLTQIPFDPATGTEADTNYTIQKDANGRIIVTAASEHNPGTKITIVR